MSDTAKSASLALLPWPRRVTRSDARLQLTAAPAATDWVRVRTLRLERAVDRLTGRMAKFCGGCAPIAIDCGAAAAVFPALGDDESYGLVIDAAEVRITAPNEWGVLRALATLAQLSVSGSALPGVLIADAPRFVWRGLMVDVARHFIDVATLLRTLDAMALFKLNVLHLHLTDDQAFRFDSRAFPELARLGSDGRYYNEDELGAIVNYAAELGIRVVPEIDMPGHTTSWFAAHPEWGAVRDTLAPSGRFGVHAACLDPTDEAVYAALGTLLDDVVRVFPDRCVHIGGDEVNPKWWSQSTPVQEFMRARGVADLDALQNLFNRRLAGLLFERGRTLVGWDEIAHNDLPRTSLVQSWRGGPSRDRAVAQGFDCIFSAGYYLDFCYPADLHYAYDPESTSTELARLDDVVRADPRLEHIREGLAWFRDFAGRAVPDTAPGSTPPGRVLGGEACMWAELVTNELIEGRVWGRLPAIAERLWSPRSLRDEADMYQRLPRTRALLAAFADIDLGARQAAAFAKLGVTGAELEALRDLLDALEPTKWYSRLLGEKALAARVAGSAVAVERPYSTTTPLDRVVDYIDPASEWAVRFNMAVRDVIDGSADDTAVALIKTSAVRWRRQREAVRTIGERVPAVAELNTISLRLAELADVADAARTGAVSSSHRALLERAKAPVGELIIAVTPVLDEWLRA